MAKNDLKNMSLSELQKLRKDVDKAIDSYQSKKKEAALKDMESVAKKHGLSLDEVIGGRVGKKSKPRLPAKFRNPENPKDTWSGRGRQPEWFKSALEKGKTRESMAV